MAPSKRLLAGESKGASTKRRRSTNKLSSLRILEEDSAFIPPLSLREPRQKAKKCALPRRPTNSNLRDPFQALTDDIVVLVITYLSAPETETLRRVSKFWKENSECYCGRAALVRHFPWAAAGLGEYLDIKDANILYRRCLYHQENLSRGFATKAIRCEAAYDWSISGGTLVWASKIGEIELQELSQHMKRPDSVVDRIKLEVGGHLVPENLAPCALRAGLRYVSLTEVGDIILQSSFRQLGNVGHDDKLSVSEKLFKITNQGEITWQKSFQSTNTCKAAVGRRAIYYIESRMSELRDVPDESSDFGSGTYIETESNFVKRDLENGEVICQRAVPPVLRSNSRIRRWVQRRNVGLSLTSGEVWAVWSNDDGQICVFSTESGHIVYRTSRNVPSAILISLAGEKFWNVDSRYDRTIPSGLYQYDNEAKTFHESVVEYQQTSRTLTSGIGVDNDRGLLFRLLHSCSPTGQSTRNNWPSDTFDPLTRIGISRLTTVPKAWGDRQGETQVEAIDLPSVTLPGTAKDRHTRRHMEVELPWTIRDGDFLGMVNDYLVYHAMRDEVLVVIDFWPDW